MTSSRTKSARSIPACAGEPHHLLGRRDERMVYPRVCGGTPQVLRGSEDMAGLSPRVRGNLTYLLGE